MKLQRYSASRNGYLSERDTGGLCRSEDVAALEAENESLRAEIERLKAPPKILKAEEVKEPGCYWWRREENTDWSVQNVYLPGAGKLLVGQFIGPIPKPEVCDD